MKAYHALLGVAAVLTIGVLAVPAAEALNREPAAHHPAALSPRDEVRVTRKTLARATSEAARLRRGIGGAALRGQVVQLERTLSRAKAQLATAEAALRTASPLAVAEVQVSREFTYARGVGYSRGQLISEAAMDYVAGHVSDTAYGYLELTHGKLPRPLANPTLGSQAGICTGAAVSFATIVHHFGFAVRSVNFYYDDPPPSNAPDGHVAVEVQYDGGWHFFDPTYGQFWTDANGKVLSISDVRAGKGSVQKNVAAFTNVFEDKVFGDDAWFITDPTTTIKFRATKLVGLK